MEMDADASIGAEMLAQAEPSSSAPLAPASEMHQRENVENGATVHATAAHTNTNNSGNYTEAAPGGSEKALQPVLTVEAMRRLTTHAPITLVDGLNPNEQFKRKEKTKWTAEEGTCAAAVVVAAAAPLGCYAPAPASCYHRPRH